MRIRQKEVQESIFRPIDRKVEQPLEPEDNYTINYTLSGMEDTLFNGFPVLQNDESPKVCAREICNRGKVSFWVKLNRDGRFHNPLTDNQFKRRSNIQKQLGERFVQIRQRPFELYRKFLVTKNVRYLRNAEQESI